MLALAAPKFAHLEIEPMLHLAPSKNKLMQWTSSFLQYCMDPEKKPQQIKNLLQAPKNLVIKHEIVEKNPNDDKNLRICFYGKLDWIFSKIGHSN